MKRLGEISIFGDLDLLSINFLVHGNIICVYFSIPLYYKRFLIWSQYIPIKWCFFYQHKRYIHKCDIPPYHHFLTPPDDIWWMESGWNWQVSHPHSAMTMSHHVPSCPIMSHHVPSCPIISHCPLAMVPCWKPQYPKRPSRSPFSQATTTFLLCSLDIISKAQTSTEPEEGSEPWGIVPRCVTGDHI